MAQPAWLQAAPAAGGSQPAKAHANKKQTGDQWTALGVNSAIVKNLVLRGFKSPTPIQRTTIPLSLAVPPRDVLGMARTGSGKTLAYVIPLLQRLGTEHKETPGPRALVMCPTRELALQILKVAKDLARGSKKGKEQESQPLRWSVIIGGTSLDTQFESMSQSPDIVICTPGRFLHLLVEMKLDLKSTELVIYDEADRLFEMGFESQLHEITHRLPPTRQSLLFSATLPTTVAEFAKASLNNPNLIRLDADSSLSPDLRLSFYLIRPSDKDAALAICLRNLLRQDRSGTTERSPQAIVFCATKHHVEYLTTMITASGYTTSSVFGSLDQVARQQQMRSFREGESEVLVVTDVAARGLDIPVMDNVINYDHPPNTRLFIHRVGRTARAGQKGRAVSLVTKDDLPYLCDLEAVIAINITKSDPPLLGNVPSSLVDEFKHSLRGLEQEDAQTLPALREVMRKGQSMYERSRAKASGRGYRNAKDIDIASVVNDHHRVHPDFENEVSTSASHQTLLNSLANFNPSETVMEMGNKGKTSVVGLMTERRRVLQKKKDIARGQEGAEPRPAMAEPVVTTNSADKFRDPQFFMQHEKSGREREKGYSMANDQSFAEGLQSSTLDLQVDEGRGPSAQKASQLRWDRKKKRFAASDQVGGDNKKMIRSESGALLPATYDSGRYQEWRSKRKRSGAQNGRPESSSSVPGIKNGILDARAIHQKRQETVKRKAKNARPAQGRRKK